MKFRKITAFAAAFVMAASVFTGIPANTETASPFAITAEAADSDFIVQKDDSSDAVLIKGYKGKGGDITIPSGYYIAAKAFYENDNITSVTFEGFGLVGESAFSGCSALKSVTFEEDASLIRYAFECCPALETVTIKGSIFGRIDTGAFQHCSSLKTVKIEKNEEEFVIGLDAFESCLSLKSINIPSKCTGIGAGAFLNCPNLEKLTIPANTEIVEDANGLTCTFGHYSDSDFNIYVADGVKEEYFSLFYTPGTKNKWSGGEFDKGSEVGNNLYYAPIKMVPKAITLTVTKGSPAEKWAKENGIKYKYASSSSSSKLAAPTGFKASKTQTKITITWNTVKNADAYRVYKYNEKTGKYEKYKDVKSAKCTVSGLTKNTKYKFKVVALVKNSNGKYETQTTSKAFGVTTKK